MHNVDWRGIQEQILDSVLLLAHRVSGLGVEGELMRASPSLDDDLPRFVALSAEALDFVNTFRGALDDPAIAADDGSQLLVIADQCVDTLQRIRKRALTVGTSLHLSYLLTRSEQSLERLRELVTILTASHALSTRGRAIAAWADFLRAAFLAENRRNSLGHYMSQLSRLLAVRVTENAARSGEHYICETRGDYGRMWRSAAGAGVLIGGMALLKIFAAGLQAPLLVEAFLFSLVYGLGFVAIFLLGMTVATKQPAMTAQTLAGLLGDVRATRQAELDRLVDVVAAVCRSQLAAIAGNVMVALPVAILLGLGLGQWLGAPVISLDKGAHLMADLDPVSWAIPHAAIAGFFLFLSGLISGYFDNKAAYSDTGVRIARLRWLNGLFGQRAGSAHRRLHPGSSRRHHGQLPVRLHARVHRGRRQTARPAAGYPAHRFFVGQSRLFPGRFPVRTPAQGHLVGRARHRADRADQSGGQFRAGAAHRARRPRRSLRSLGGAAARHLAPFPAPTAQLPAAATRRGDRQRRVK